MTEYSKSHLRSELGRVRYLGSARHGARHWWTERMLALALVPLSVWFVVDLVVNLLGASRSGVQAWVAQPLTALLLAALTVAAFLHTKMGLTVVIEDYIHTEWKKISLLIIKDVAVWALLIGTLAAIAKLHFIGN